MIKGEAHNCCGIRTRDRTACDTINSITGGMAPSVRANGHFTANTGSLVSEIAHCRGRGRFCYRVRPTNKPSKKNVAEPTMLFRVIGVIASWVRGR